MAAADFLVSYTGADQAWAEWIAEQLEAAGYTTLLQAWDFRPGSDFVHQMQQATSSAQRTVAVLSPAYFGSRFGEAEWRAAFAKDPYRGAGAAGPGPSAGLPAAGATGQPNLCRPGRPGRGDRCGPAAGRNPAGTGSATGPASLPRPGNHCRGLAVSGSTARDLRGAGPQPQLHRPQ